MTLIIIICLAACIATAVAGINYAMTGRHTQAVTLICFSIVVGLIPFFIVIEALNHV